MKKIISFILLLSMLLSMLSLTACNVTDPVDKDPVNNENPAYDPDFPPDDIPEDQLTIYQILNRGLKKTASSNSYSFATSTRIAIECKLLDTPIVSSLKVEADVVDANSDKPKLSGQTSTFFGMTDKFYSDGENIYIPETKTKTAIDEKTDFVSSMKKMLVTKFEEGDLGDDPKLKKSSSAAYKDIRYVREKFTPKDYPEEFKEIVDDASKAFDELNQQLSQSSDPKISFEKLNIEDLEIEIRLHDNGYLTAIIFTLTMKSYMHIGGSAGNATIESIVSLTFDPESLENGVKVDLPDDLDTYEFKETE